MFSRTRPPVLTFGQYLTGLGLRPDQIARDEVSEVRIMLELLVQKDGLAVTPETVAAKIQTLCPNYGEKDPVRAAHVLRPVVRAAYDEAKLPQSVMLQNLTGEFLQKTGTPNASPSQIDKTAYALNEALGSEAWKTFVSPLKKRMNETFPSVDEARDTLFGEDIVFSDSDLKLAALKLTRNEAQSLAGSFEDGAIGRLLAASFVDWSHRDSGDFTHAYGAQAWECFVRAHTRLERIPKRTFASALDVDLICATNGLVDAPDPGIVAGLKRFSAGLIRGHVDSGGALRKKAHFAAPQKYTADQLANLQAEGIKTRSLTPKRQWLEYPPAEQVRPLLERAIATLKDTLAKADADPIDAAADFERTFVAIHPFEDGNGRTARLIMNRILADYDLPPAILRNQNADLVRSKTQWRADVRQAVARGKRSVSSISPARAYLTMVGLPLPPSRDQPVLIGKMPYNLGSDGLLYDLSGRSHLVCGGALVPLAQMEHYVLARRVMMMGTERGTQKLAELTAETRALYVGLVAEPAGGDKITVVADTRARSADVAYALDPLPAIAQVLTSLATTASLDKERLFTIVGGLKKTVDGIAAPRDSGFGTPQSATMSKYTQVDLEWWYLETGLRKASQPELAAQVHHEREKLFLLAKQALKKNTNAARVTRENPYGFAFRYEWMMLRRSPLRFSSLMQALDHIGDDHVTVWRGTYSLARALGMAPANDGQKDARAVAKERAKRGAETNLVEDLVNLEGSAVGSPYISITSDLSLLLQLRAGYAAGKEGRTVNISGLPKALRRRVFAAVSGKDGLEIKDRLGIPGSAVTLNAQTDDHVRVTTDRKVFELQVPKSSLLPGLCTLGTGVFNSEQELHGLERVLPWKIRAVYEATILRQPFAKAPPSDA